MRSTLLRSLMVGAEHPPEPAPDMRAWLQTPVGQIMTRKVIAVTADLRVEQLILLLTDENIGGAPVVDEQQQVIGVVTRSDLVADDCDWAELREQVHPLNRSTCPTDGEQSELYAEWLVASKTVADLMTRSPITALETQPVPAIAATMSAHHVHRIPIVEASGRLVGMVTALDVARWVAQQQP